MESAASLRLVTMVTMVSYYSNMESTASLRLVIIVTMVS